MKDGSVWYQGRARAESAPGERPNGFAEDTESNPNAIEPELNKKWLKITQDELPYSELRFATTKRGGRHVEHVGSAITAGSAQYREAYLRPGGRIADSEGVLVFLEEGFRFYADSGETFRWGYEAIASFKTGWTLQPLVKKFDVRIRDGSKASFRIGPQLLANASYIFGRVVA